MLSRCQGKTFSMTLLAAFVFTSQGCGRSIAATPSMPTAVTTETSLPASKQTPSPKLTLANTAMTDSTATASMFETASIGTLVTTTQPTVIANYPSSDGNWRVEVIRYDCTYVDHNFSEKIAYEQLKLINLTEGTEKTVVDQKQNCGGLGAYGLKGLYWSRNNRYFYYNDSREGYPDGGCGAYVPPIYRLDPVTQEVTSLKRSFLSPDKTKLALWERNEIAIWDLDRGEIARVTAYSQDLPNGRIWWSRHGTSLVYLQTQSECAPDLGKSAMVNLDLTNLSQTLIAKYELTSTGFVSTPTPVGVFVFYFYAPLIMNYNPSIWEIKPGLRAKELTSCSIGEQGPTDFIGPHTSQVVRLDNLKYEVLSFPDSSPNVISKVYIADQSLATEAGLPVFWVSAKSNEWDKCKSLAEKVLSTLRFPP